MPDKTCFVIAPIGDLGTEIRKRSDQVLKHIIRPAVEAKGYKAIRADEIAEPGIITTQVIQHIIDDPLVIADLSGRNPNVFYELALRHALRKPLVQIIQEGEDIPFDVHGMRTIDVNHQDLDSAANAKIEIERQIEAVEQPGAKIESPISMTVDLQSLRQSDNPEQRTLADIVSGMAEMRNAMASMQKQLDGITAPPPVLQQFGRVNRPPYVNFGDSLGDLAGERNDLLNQIAKKEVQTEEEKERLRQVTEYMRILMKAERAKKKSQ